MGAKQRIKVGDVIEIPLPNGKNAYARRFNNGKWGFYLGYYQSYKELADDSPYAFFSTVFLTLESDGIWRKVGHRPFLDESADAPASVYIDGITGDGRLLVDNRLVSCPYEDCKNLEPAVVWDRVSIIRRLLGENIFSPTMVPRPPSMTVQEWQQLFTEWQQRCTARHSCPESAVVHTPHYLADSISPRISKNTAEEYKNEIIKINYEITLAEQETSVYSENAIDVYLKRIDLMRCLYAAGYGYDVLQEELQGLIDACLSDWKRGGLFGNPVRQIEYSDVYAWCWFLDCIDDVHDKLFEIYQRACINDPYDELIAALFSFGHVERYKKSKKTGSYAMDKIFKMLPNSAAIESYLDGLLKCKARDLSLGEGFGSGLELELAMVLDSAQIIPDRYSDDDGFPLELVKYKNR